MDVGSDAGQVFGSMSDVSDNGPMAESVDGDANVISGDMSTDNGEDESEGEGEDESVGEGEDEGSF